MIRVNIFTFVIIILKLIPDIIWNLKNILKGLKEMSILIRFL